MSRYFTYMVSNKKRGTIYTGMSNDVIVRTGQHKRRVKHSFTKRYNLEKLVWYETFSTALEAINREKEIKGWIRSKKIALIEASNPEWNDLYDDLAAFRAKKFSKMSMIWNYKKDE